MIVLSQTTDKIQVVLSGAVATSEAQCVASWRDITSAPSYVAGRSLANTNGTTDVDLIAAPAAATQRIIDHISIYNADTAAIGATFKFDASGADYVLWSGIIAPAEMLIYSDSTGWKLERMYSPKLSIAFHAHAGANFAMTNATNAERFAGNTSRHIFTADLSGYTQVRVIAKVEVASASVNTPLMRLRYYGVYSAVHANFLQLGASAHVDLAMDTTGYRDTGWIPMDTGACIDGVYLAFCELGGDGAADPAIGNAYVLFR